MTLIKKLLFLLIALTSSTFAINIIGCGSEKQCIFNPENCTISSASCHVFTYAWNPIMQHLEMEIRGIAVDSESAFNTKYNSIAFSLTGLMETSDVYACIGPFGELKTGYIGERHGSADLEDELLGGVREISSSVVDGVLECRFTRPISVSRFINQSFVEFNLSANEYYVLQASAKVISFAGVTALIPHTVSNRFSSGPFMLVPNRTRTSSNRTSFSTTPTPVPVATPTPVPVTIPTPVSATTYPSGVPIHSDAECGVSRRCFKSPSGCTIGENNCMFAAWSYNSTSDVFDIVLIGGSPGRYVAIAFGTENKMMNADLYYCTENNLYSGAIREYQFEPYYFTTLPEGVSLAGTALINGLITCAFVRPASVTKLTLQETTFNLVTTDYYLLYAVGEYSGFMAYHDYRAISDSPIQFVSDEYKTIQSPTTVMSNTSRKAPEHFSSAKQDPTKLNDFKAEKFSSNKIGMISKKI